MMKKNGKLLEFNEEQRRIFIDAQQLWEAFLALHQEKASCRGGMYWKRVNGKEYLVRLLDSRGSMKSLGPRSPETERIYTAWQRKKEELCRREKALRERAGLIRKMCRALNLNRVPLVVAKIAREMFFVKEVRKRMLIVGTNAIYAYEALAGVFIPSGLLATRDLDVLWDARSHLRIAGVPRDGFLGLLKRADSSFRLADTPYRAVNKEGFWVELLKPVPRSLSETRVSLARVSTFPEDLLALETKGTRWIVSCPKVSTVAIGHDGFPVPLVVPDPRAFVLHKLWVAQQPDRSSVKKQRDVAQALLVYHLLEQYLPVFSLDYHVIEKELQALPSKLRELANLLESVRNKEQDGSPFLPFPA